MFKEKYKVQLIKQAIKNDELVENINYEQAVNEIVEEGNEDEILHLLKNMSYLSKDPSQKSKQEILFFELLCKYLGAEKVEGLYLDLKADSDISLDDLIQELDSLIGLENIKNHVKDLIYFHQVQKMREKNGFKKAERTLHMAFLGNPGTGKTTVARIVGRMYKAIGLLSKGHFIEASRTDLIAEYQGQTAVKVKRLIERAKGGVLFIDEAYSLTENDHSDSYGRESLTELTKALEDYRDDLVVIVAGYTDLMEAFFESNPGLKSRFNTFIYFEDYSVRELKDIFKYICKQNDYIPDDNALIKIKNYLQMDWESKNKNFSNARLARNLFDDTVMNQSRRLIQQNKSLLEKDLILIKSDDIPDHSHLLSEKVDDEISF